MNDNVQQLTEWFNANRGQQLLINKEELEVGTGQVSDHDQVRLWLEKVTLRQLEKEDAEHYLASQEVLLYGRGIVHSEAGEAPLPQQVYEIPLQGHINLSHQERNMRIQTERARYTIQVE
ncbi:hypothetical protein J2S00_001935 [Caldalkalibacillus uzonensis]|uniref:Uncharacterized protein n=1 Tax=Caldalkalibacillus uzonensis TaxID=353224 RepID=A0ABU0CS21_9BACI|nr:hypothetical protein [Caldalkalibacillus uzonensis]MDQ0339149.1 hypothetical protein [Caldalkalibacillus uzonensis]